MVFGSCKLGEISMPKDQLKIFGTFRSGSNLVRALLQLNYNVLVHNNTYAFKHAPVPASFEDGVFKPFPYRIVGIVKDPFAFIVSAFEFCHWNNFRHISAGRSFDEFIKNKFVVYDGDFEGFPKYWFKNPIQYWNSINYTLLSIPDDHCQIVKYENLLSDVEKEISRLAKNYRLHRAYSSFLKPQGITKNLGENESERPDDYTTGKPFTRKRYYLQREYMKQFSDSQKRFISSELDPEVVGTLSYQLPID